MTDEKQEYYKSAIIHSIAEALQRGGRALDSLPGLLLKCIREDLWVERDINGGIIRYDKTEFKRFVESPFPEGLSSTIEVIEKLCADNLEIVDFLAAAKRREPYKHIPKDDNDNISIKPLEHGTSQAYALQRLRDQAPQLHQRVLDGELSPHAAMVEAGFRKKKVSISVDDPESTAKTLVKNLDAETLDEVIERLLVEQKKRLK